MTALFLLIPAALLLAGLGVLGFRWAVRSGQYDDVRTPALRMLLDDEDETSPKPNG
ncbi:MAG: cbb3-type cytochrome oxidase assembly protein CcoS [Bacteroidetes bacterium]|nr:cbb3-type cytochrome oxidase assembly protein CcoS [Bacteroidota bacterium]